MGTAGYPIIRRPRQLPILKRYRFLNPGETKAQWYERTLKAIRDKSFFSDILYRNNAPYEEFKAAIYEPGDILQDLQISFTNPQHPYMLLGVWDCPIPTKLGDDFDTNNGTFETLKHEYIDVREKIDKVLENPNSINELTAVTLASQQEDLVKQLDQLEREGKAIQDHLPLDPNNYASRMALAKMYETTLSEVIHQINRTPMYHKPIRFIVVEACRSISLEHGNVGMNVLQSVMRAVKENMPLKKQAARIPGFREYEKEAQRRRRPSLLARRLPQPSQNLGGATGGGAAVVSLVPSFTYNIANLKRVASGISKRSKIGGVQAPQIVAALEKDRAVPLDLLEELFEDYTQAGYAVMTRNIQTMMSGLAPEHRFAPDEFVQYVDESGGERGVFILGPKNEGGVIEFDTVFWDTATESPIRRTINPLALRRYDPPKGDGDEERDLARAMIMGSGFDFEVEIEKLKAEQLLALTQAKGMLSTRTAALPPLTSSGATAAPTNLISERGFTIETGHEHNKPLIIGQLEAAPHIIANKFVIFKHPKLGNLDADITGKLKWDTAKYQTQVQITFTDPASSARRTGFAFIQDLVPRAGGGGGRGKSRSLLSGKLCRCIKRVRKTVKVRKGSRGGKESAAIGICVRSVLGKRGRTLRKFKCGKKAYVETQDPLKKSR
jgi:hypothetical protein